MKGKFKIETISAFIVVDDDGTEGVLGIPTQHGVLPMVAADEKRIESLEPAAQRLATAIRKTVTLARFSIRTDLKQIEPDRTKPAPETARFGDWIGIRKEGKAPPPSQPTDEEWGAKIKEEENGPSNRS